MSRLDVRRACELAEQSAAQRWLIEGLWAESAVGIVGGEPKCCKSFLGLCMAVSVAAGVPCLGHFPVARSGPVLLFAAEDAPHIVRARLQGIGASARVPWDSLDIHVIIDPVVRLDVPEDRGRLLAEVERLRPRLVVLDPFVRLHRIDENAAAEVAPLLAYLRELQRTLGCAVVLVHHARKGGHARAGQALRGSSELHAWGDSNLYMRRDGERLLLSIEHRAAASSSGIELALGERDGGLTLHVRDDVGPAPAERPRSPAERVLDALADATAPLTRRELRDACHLRNATLALLLACTPPGGEASTSDASSSTTEPTTTEPTTSEPTTSEPTTSEPTTSTTGPTCPAGQEHCPCAVDSPCAAGLACVFAVCVAVDLHGQLDRYDLGQDGFAAGLTRGPGLARAHCTGLTRADSTVRAVRAAGGPTLGGVAGHGLDRGRRRRGLAGGRGRHRRGAAVVAALEGGPVSGARGHEHGGREQDEGPGQHAVTPGVGQKRA